MASSTQPPTSDDKINFVLDIHVMRSLLHSIHSTDLIHRQPTEAQRAAYADTVSTLEQRIARIEEQLRKRKSVGRRLERWLTCRDRDYERFVALQGEVNRVYSVLMINATPTPTQKNTTPDSSNSGSSSDRGLWMAGSGIPGTRRRDTDESTSTQEPIPEFGPGPEITLTMPESSHASEGSGSSSTIKASSVNPPMKGDEERNVDEQARPSEIPASTEAGQDEFKPRPKSTKLDSGSNGGLWTKKTNSKKGVEIDRKTLLWEMDHTDYGW